LSFGKNLLRWKEWRKICGKEVDIEEKTAKRTGDVKVKYKIVSPNELGIKGGGKEKEKEILGEGTLGTGRNIL